MTRVTVDLTTGATLQNLPEGSEICNPAGQLLGYFWPVAPKSLYDEVDIPFTEEELDEAEREEGGRPLGEILRDLEKHG